MHHQLTTKPNPSLSIADTPLTQAQLRCSIFNGTIASAVSDTGATSTAGAPHDPFHPAHTKSTKAFVLPTGSITQASTATTLLLNLRPPANQVEIVSKLADAGWSYEATDAHTLGYGASPLQPLNQNTDTLLLDAPGGTTTTNPQFKIHHSRNTLAHLQTINTPDTLANVYDLPSIAQAVRYLHGAAGFPTKSTWLAAIRNGNYSTWPLINVKNFTKHFPESEKTQQGHMHGQRQGVRSTKPTGPSLPRLSTPTPLLDHTEDILINIHDNLYSDQTGKFPHISSRGNRYQMILYHVNSNSIWVEATKNRSEGEMILVQTWALQRMKVCGLAPTRQVLNNEASAAYKQAIRDSGMTYQLVPPDNHRRNLAEKAIQTWKDHFIAALSGTAEKFPLQLLVPDTTANGTPTQPSATILCTSQTLGICTTVWPPRLQCPPIHAN
eukprot:CCRYP_015258-RA/>CCRYP_015258-RA protein AED:0.58 eAED:0.58 QI:0/0/0/0.5/1/1/2/0/438